MGKILKSGLFENLLLKAKSIYILDMFNLIKLRL